MRAAESLTALYRSRLVAIQAGLQLWLRVAWAAIYDEEEPLSSLGMLGVLAADRITGAQQAAIREAVTWLAALYAAAFLIPLEQVVPFTAPPVAGTSAAGGVIADMTRITPAVYLARINAGWLAEDAGRAAGQWLTRLTASEPYRAANTTVTFNVRADDRLTGRARRITRPGACQFCTDIAAQGYSPAHAGFQAHAHCYCTAEPEIAR